MWIGVAITNVTPSGHFGVMVDHDCRIRNISTRSLCVTGWYINQVKLTQSSRSKLTKFLCHRKCLLTCIWSREKYTFRIFFRRKTSQPESLSVQYGSPFGYNEYYCEHAVSSIIYLCHRCHVMIIFKTTRKEEIFSQAILAYHFPGGW